MCAKIKTNPNESPVKPGQLCLVEINGLRIVGHYFADVAGGSWIIQPGGWIDCSGADVKVIAAL